MTQQPAAERAGQFAELYAQDRIGDQRGFYHDRRVDAEKAHDQAIHAKWALSTLAAIAGSVGAALPEVRASLAIAAAFLAAAATAMTAYQSLYAFPRIAKLYRDAEMSLTALTAAGKFPEPGVSEDQTRALIERVEKVISLENGQWGQLIRHAQESGGDNRGG